MSEEEVIKKINEIRKEYSTMDGLTEYIEAIDMILDIENKQKKEIERLNGIINSRYYHDLQCRELEIEINENWQDKIKGKLKKLEEQKEKMRFDGDVCFADYEQFCENLKFFKEQIGELLEEK